MEDWQRSIDTLRERALAELQNADGPDALEAWRISYLGRRGALTEALRGLTSLPADQRPAAGQAANETKRVLETALEQHKTEARGSALQQALEEERIDVTLP